MVRVGSIKYHYETQEIATDTETPPVQNTWYIILDTTYDVRLIYLRIYQDNDDAAAKTMEMRVTADGITFTGSFNVADNTANFPYVSTDADDLSGGTSTRNAAYYTDWRAQSVKVEFRMTAVPGLNQTMTGNVRYEKLLPT